LAGFLAQEGDTLPYDLIGGSVHTQKVFSVKPLYLSDIAISAESGVLQHSGTFHTDKFCDMLMKCPQIKTTHTHSDRRDVMA
jgi:glycyl-tRNA synthetase (class II)